MASTGSSPSSSAKPACATGKLRIALDPTERHSALTVNEFETLLMKYDLAEVLRNPLRFAAEKYRHALANPRAVPAKTLDYAKYDLVRVINKGLDTLGLRGSIVEKVMARTLAVPAARFFRMSRSISLLVSVREDGLPEIVQGPYQSPILVQWQQAPTPRQGGQRLAHRDPLKQLRAGSSEAGGLARQPLGNLRHGVGNRRDGRRGLGHLFRRDPLHGVGRGVMHHEVAGGVAEIRHRRDVPGLRDRTDVRTSSTWADLGEVERREATFRSEAARRGPPRFP